MESKIGIGLTYNPERINDPDLKCDECKKPIPLGINCIEIINEGEHVAYVCSVRCHAHLIQQNNFIYTIGRALELNHISKKQYDLILEIWEKEIIGD